MSFSDKYASIIMLITRMNSLLKYVNSEMKASLVFLVTIISYPLFSNFLCLLHLYEGAKSINEAISRFQDLVPQYAIDLTESDNMTLAFTLSMYETNTASFRAYYDDGDDRYETLSVDSVLRNGHAMLSALHNGYYYTHGGRHAICKNRSE